jgi:acyl-CoA reductase-like NAD-dependent aldehyde dehydrogenase
MERKIFFEGKWQEGNKYFEVYKKGTEEAVYRFPEASPEQVERAISYLERNREKIKSLSCFDRYKILETASHILEKRKEEISRVIAIESGKTIKEARVEVERGIETFRFSAEEAKRIYGEVIPMDASKFGKGKIGFTLLEPIGIVLAITPFNFPLNLALHKIAPAVAAGCSVVFKPASYTAETGRLIVEILLESGFPPEGIAFLTGGGGRVGELLVRDKRIRHISFTGSKEIGERITNIAGMKTITLELGSNSALCIFPDFNYESVIDKMVKGAYALAGQVCISIQRIYVEKSIKEDFINKYLERVRKIRVGDQLKEETDMGPMISESAAQQAEEWIRKAEQRGGKVMPELKRKGSFLYPVVIIDAPEDTEVCKKEAFAPLVVINSFETEEEVVQKINDSEYGLQAGIFTKDIKRALRLARKIEVGGVMIGEIPTFRVDHMPYGGVKMSGIGREGPKYAIEEFLEKKLVVIQTE